jgi:hypothetical protein
MAFIPFIFRPQPPNTQAPTSYPLFKPVSSTKTPSREYLRQQGERNTIPGTGRDKYNPPTEVVNPPADAMNTAEVIAGLAVKAAMDRAAAERIGQPNPPFPVKPSDFPPGATVPLTPPGQPTSTPITRPPTRIPGIGDAPPPVPAAVRKPVIPGNQGLPASISNPIADTSTPTLTPDQLGQIHFEEKRAAEILKVEAAASEEERRKAELNILASALGGYTSPLVPITIAKEGILANERIKADAEAAAKPIEAIVNRPDVIAVNQARLAQLEAKAIAVPGEPRKEVDRARRANMGDLDPPPVPVVPIEKPE